MTTTARDLEEAAARLLEEKNLRRRDAIPPLAAVAAAKSELEEKLAEIRRKYASLYQEAERAEWRPEELRKIGFKAPAVRAAGRPRRSPTRPVPTRDDVGEHGESAPQEQRFDTPA